MNIAAKKKNSEFSAAEIGVFQGQFMQQNLKYWPGDYYAVDAWRFRKAGIENPTEGIRGDKNFGDSKTHRQNFYM